jgi:hypothetical protein
MNQCLLGVQQDWEELGIKWSLEFQNGIEFGACVGMISCFGSAQGRSFCHFGNNTAMSML